MISGITAALLAFVLVTAVATALFKDVLAAIILFAAYSLGMAMFYTLLLAPDVALTEAAVSAGITTIFLLLTIAKTVRPSEDRTFLRVNWPALGVVGLFVLALARTLVEIPPIGSRDAPIWANPDVTQYYLDNAYAETGAENAVTAVLAAYRGFDTFGEAVVVFVAGIAVLLILRQEVFT